MPDSGAGGGVLHSGAGADLTALAGALSAALRTALGSTGPALLDVVTEPWQTPITAHRDALRGEATTGYGG